MSPAPTRPKTDAYGFVEWFRPGEYQRTEECVEQLTNSGARYLRTHLSWAEFHAPGGQQWYDWLMPRLGEHFELLPCVHYTPPSLSRNGKSSGAPRVLKDYADFVDHVLTRYGRHFQEIELWNEPNNLLDWDWRADPDYRLFCEMITGAAHWVRERGWKAILGGPCPFDPVWLDLMGQRGVLELFSAVGFHGFPGTWDSDAGSWGGWERHLREMREIISRYNDSAEMWITETGYSTWRNDEIEQVRKFVDALDVGADRLYWYSWRDVPHDIAVQEGLWFDPRHYHLGAVHASGHPKLLARLLMNGGSQRAREIAQLATPPTVGRKRPILVVGGSGFIGSNLANSYLADGEDVIVLDNLSRPNVDANLEWLSGQYGSHVRPYLADIRDTVAIEDAFSEAKAVFHFAAQTAVTTSMEDPRHDFDVNLRGTFNVLEAVKRTGARIPVIFASTNKVYGDLEDIEMVELDDRYIPADEAIRAHGIGEDRPLDFCTPYGCSKGAADQYVLDYAKSFGIPTAVMRMSCVYGPRQFGTEDQGWVAHFLIRALMGKPITLYGDGKQVRDILHVEDAVSAYRAVLANIDSASGAVYNLGGGPHNAVSLKLVLGEIGRLIGREIHLDTQDWRPGDQQFFVADTRKLEAEFGWRARIGWRDGLKSLALWLASERMSNIPKNEPLLRSVT